MTRLAISPEERRVLTALSVAPRSLSGRELSEILYMDREDGGPLFARECVQAYVQSLRKKLGLSIEAGPWRGYRLTDADRAKLRRAAA